MPLSIDDINCYPNPFSTTTLECNLSSPQEVTLAVYDYAGKQVDLIQKSSQKGSNKVVWTPENLADGVYYFRLQTGEQVGSGKVVLMK